MPGIARLGHIGPIPNVRSILLTFTFGDPSGKEYEVLNEWTFLAGRSRIRPMANCKGWTI